MKRIFVFFYCFAALIFVVSCGGDSQIDGDDNSESSSEDAGIATDPGDIRVSDCTGLPENAQWNTVSEITQTWNGSDWEPDNVAIHNDKASTTECRFKCRTNYFWNGTACSNQCSPNPCKGISNSTGVCTVNGSSYVCGCISGYNWTGVRCLYNSSDDLKSLGNICTGQTKCYDDVYNKGEIDCPTSSNDDFYGQDAQYTGKCTAQSFTSSSNVVFDNNTGLTWEKSPSEENYTWEKAQNHCDDLNNSNYGGKSNWRLPNPLELLTIVDNDIEFPAINSNFTNITTDESLFLWTSKEYGGDTTFARAFDAFFGGYHGEKWKTETLKVLCVSGNEITAAESDDFIVSSDGKTVTDSRTGLMWQKKYEKETVWLKALKYCEELDYAGYSDWRLPNKNELSSLLDFGKSNEPYSNFPEMRCLGFWSSTTKSTSTDFAWTISLCGYGLVNTHPKVYPAKFICVR